jgi:hypothetical protein
MKGVLVVLVLAAGTALAQPMAAMRGTPLPGPELDVGTVSVRAVAGSPSSPVPNVDVTLTVNGTPRQARTDSEGRAFFKELPVGASVQAKIQDEDGKDVTSEQFQIPDQGGTKLMLSTRPPQPGMAGPMMGGEGGAMPEPRKLSGQPRPEQADPPGSFTVRLTYDDLKDETPPAGIEVALVGFAADEGVTFQHKPTDAQGRAQFTDLDRTGATAYFAMALMPRNGAVDRLVAQPVTMFPQIGGRVLLSSEKRTSTAAAIDDTGDDGAAPGKVRVVLEGQPVDGGEITIFDVESHAPLGKQVTKPGPPDTSQIQGAAPFEPKADLPKGTVDIEVDGGAGTDTAPLAHVGVKIVPGDASLDAPPADAPSAETGADGKAHLVAPPGPKRAILHINGRDIPTDTFDISASGGVLRVEAHWPTSGPPEATFDVVPRPGQAVYAEARVAGQTYRSRPFQLVEGKGARVGVAVLPRIMFAFSMTSHIDDKFLAVQGRFELYNNSWIPYVGSDGVLVPLPKGFKGAILADQDQSDVAVAQGEGFRVVRPLAPGVRRFIGGFSLPVEGGSIDWNLDLPFETWQSGIEIMQVPGMSVKTPAGVTGRTETDKRGTWYVLAPISIHAGQSMVMSISGMPSEPAWKVWAPRVLGILVIGGLLAGLLVALLGRRQAAPVDAGRDGRRQRLLDELVELERAGAGEGGAARREQILAELEKLWDAG